jgi:hypothetical protein
MNLALWIVAGLLAAVFLLASATKLFLPKERLAKAPGGGWVNHFSTRAIKTIGGLEILGVIGLIGPQALHIATILTPLAAVGLALIMVGAVITRIRIHDVKPIAVELTYLAAAVFVAWGRFG